MKLDYHLIGAGHIAEKYIKKYPEKTYMVYDNNKDLHGSKLLGNTVHPVNHLIDQTEGVILICTTSIAEVKSQLDQLPTKIEVMIPPELAEFEAQNNLMVNNRRFLIASGLPSNNLHGACGGLCLVEERERQVQTTTILSGPCHSVVKYGDYYFVTEQEEGIITLDENLNVVDRIKLKSGSRPHGLCVDDTYFYVVASNLDAVLQVKRADKSTKTLNLSNKFQDFKTAQHHANDIEIIGSYAYVSMFSISGNWKRGVYDGGLIEIDLKNGNTKQLSFDLKLPHSVRNVDGSLIVLNSFLGEFESFGRFPNFSFNGFLRGFDYDDRYFYLAESRNRNSTGLRRKTLPASIDSNLVMVDRNSYYSRTIPLPQDISEIHSILVL